MYRTLNFEDTKSAGDFWFKKNVCRRFEIKMRTGSTLKGNFGATSGNMSNQRVKDRLMRANTELLGIEKSVKPFLLAEVGTMFLVITSHHTNHP